MKRLPIFTPRNKQTHSVMTQSNTTPKFTEADRVAEIQAMSTRMLGEIVANCPIGHETFNRAIEELKRRGY